MSNPSSMIAEEAYWSIAFGVLMLVDFVLLLRRGTSPGAVRVVAAVAAVGLMCIMGWAYFTSYGNPAWATWQTLPLFVQGDLAMGAALWGLMREGAYRSDAFAAAFAVLGALAVASIALIAAHFAGLGYGALPFAAAVVLVVAGVAFGWLAWKDRLSGAVAPVLAFACLFAGVAAARYAFYAASVL